MCCGDKKIKFIFTLAYCSALYSQKRHILLSFMGWWALSVGIKEAHACHSFLNHDSIWHFTLYLGSRETEAVCLSSLSLCLFVSLCLCLSVPWQIYPATLRYIHIYNCATLPVIVTKLASEAVSRRKCLFCLIMVFPGMTGGVNSGGCLWNNLTTLWKV